MKIINLILILFSVTSIGFAQNIDTLKKQINNISFGTNMSIPNGEFAKNDLSVDKSGFAEYGVGLRLSSTKTIYKNFGIAISIISNSYSVNKKIYQEYSKFAEHINSNYLTFGKWFNFSINIGIDYTILFKDIYFSFKLNPGLFISSRPSIESGSISVGRGKGLSFVLIPEIYIAHKITKNIYLGIFASLINTKVKLEYKIQSRSTFSIYEESPIPYTSPTLIATYSNWETENKSYVQKIFAIDFGLKIILKK